MDSPNAHWLRGHLVSFVEDHEVIGEKNPFVLVPGPETRPYERKSKL